MLARISAFGAGLLVIILSTPAAVAAIYRCDEDGRAVFRDHPCRTGQPPEVVVPQVAGDAGLRPSERAWLSRRAARRKAWRRSGRHDAGGGDGDAQARRCWNKQRRLQEVQARLRAGYKASQGNRLRRQRRQYEDYLARFCN